MAKTRFNEQLHAYARWKEDLQAAIHRYQGWLDANKMGNPEDELRIYEIEQSLKADRLTIAFVAEFARGKTELINAIFFSEYDRRLLPSEARRTTMCPTELFYDTDASQAYIRLLPIETRLQEPSISEYKADPIHWTHIDLQLDSPESMAEAFQEIVQVKHVTPEEAHALGLYFEEPGKKPPTTVEIPMWRHALISFPHPLLKQGLVILDTPGLNALGSEPELTINMLPNAQSVVFVMAADTGVTKSDQDMWLHHVKPLHKGKEKGLLVVLNKDDTLWDELKEEKAIAHTVAEQCRKAAETLGVNPAMVFPASAQKGLLAKIRHDQALLERSNILTLENIFASEILPYKQSIVRDHVSHEVGAMIQESRDLLASRHNSVSKQLKELAGLSGKNNEVITHLMKTTREEQVAYYKNVESFQANKKLLAEQSKKLLQLVSLDELDTLVSSTRKKLSGSWTTHGLKDGMKHFFDGVTEKFREVTEYSEQLNRLVITVYRKFHQEHGITEIKPVLFSAGKYMKEMHTLYQEAEAFRNSPVTTMTEQSFVVKKFFISLVSHARNIFFKAHRDAEHWSKAVMSPLVKQIKDHKEQMEKRLDNLRRINESRDTLQSRIDELEKAKAVLDKQLAEVQSILDIINRPLEEIVVEQAKAAVG